MIKVLFILLSLSLNLRDGLRNFRPGERTPSRVEIEEYSDSAAFLVHITGHSDRKGGTSSWTYVRDIPEDFKEGAFLLKVRGRGNLRISVYFKKGGTYPYYFCRKSVNLVDTVMTVRIPTNEAKPIWSSNFPQALLADGSADLFLFLDNAAPGSLDVYVEGFILEGEK